MVARGLNFSTDLSIDLNIDLNLLQILGFTNKTISHFVTECVGGYMRGWISYIFVILSVS
jgi:hypothetical protein